VIEKSFAPLELPGAGIKDIRSLIEFYASAINGPAAGRGCLLCNTAVEFGSQDTGNTGFVQLYFKRLSRAFNISLNNAYRNGELHNSVSPGKEADYFTATILGLFVMIRAKVQPSMIKNAAEMAIKHLEELTV
jgi:TetR/AcrR family transcriptional regulator, transcriptional repressor for nem operon